MRSLIASIVVAAALLVVGCADKKDSAQQSTNPEAGKKIAEKSCVGCHGLDGKGANDDIPNLAAQVEPYLVAAIHAYKEGKRHHAALKDMATKLSDADARNIAAFYASLPPVTSAQQPIQDIAEKGKAAAAVCAGCHGTR